MTGKLTWKCLRVLSPDDEDPMYPSIGSGAYPFELEPDDGDVKRCIAKGLALHELEASGLKRLLGALKDEDVEVYVTECRVVYVIEKWNKGDRYWGVGLGSTAAALKNVANSVREARERRGRLLMGHIRYNWISDVGAQGPKGLAGNAHLRVVSAGDNFDTKSMLMLDVNMGRDKSVSAIADLIASRAARFWIQLGDVKPEDRNRFDSLVENSQPLASEPGQMRTKKIPQYQFVSVKTVRSASSPQ